MSSRRRDSRLTLEQSSRLQRIRLLGQGRALSVYLQDVELGKLLSVAVTDLGMDPGEFGLPSVPWTNYYQIPFTWFEDEDWSGDVVGQYVRLSSEVADFGVYFESLCEIHKRRLKYGRILESQPLPSMIQISPRALLEYGAIDAKALASWIVWRKWVYDIDNRSAQETGYLFEPILARALGGESYNSRRSPVRRTNDKSKGRQVDCIVGRYAYEFKMRVTIAASGQGRFAEELDFARDCYNSDFTPILLVLDPTPSKRLEELTAEFEKFGGKAYIGDDAWTHLEADAGPTMATFVESYVRQPLASLDEYSTELLDLAIRCDPDQSAMTFRLGNDNEFHEWTVERSPLAVVKSELES